jgi:hypothetical protein
MMFFRLMIALGLSFAISINAAELVNPCLQLASQSKIIINYTDIFVSEDYSKPTAYLKALADNALDQHHNVFGLTHAEPKLEYQLHANFAKSPDGKICAIPDLTINAGFTSMKVYLAQEVTSSCRRQIIREHEYEHVAAWKSHLRAGTRLLENPLRVAFSEPRYYESSIAAEQDLKPWVSSMIKPLEQRLFIGLNQAQHAIDSPMSYEHVEAKLRSCPPL